MKIPFVDLSAQYLEIRDELLSQIDLVAKRGIYVLGEECELLEQELSEYCQSVSTVTVGNGSDALFLILKVLGIGKGDEVITVPNSFIATAWTIVATGAKVRFCDVDDGLNLDPQKLETIISPNTKAIIPVHLAGIPCKMDLICKISESYGIPIIEDCAQAIGASFQGKKVGNFGVAGGFSLHPLKNLGVMGDGGFITTKDHSIARELRTLRNHGLKNREEVISWGYNSRLDELQAAIARIKLKMLPIWNMRVSKLAMNYRTALKEKFLMPEVSKEAEPVWHNFMILSKQRDKLMMYLKEKGIETKIHYPIPIHLQTVFEGQYNIGDFPKSERQSKESMSLPIHPHLSDLEAEYIVESLLRFKE